MLPSDQKQQLVWNRQKDREPAATLQRIMMGIHELLNMEMTVWNPNVEDLH